MPVFFYMSAIKDGRYPIELNGKQYHLLFDLNVLDEVQDKFGGYDKLNEVFKQDNPRMMKDLKWLLTMLINEGMEDEENELTEKQVGKMIHMGNFAMIQEAILKSFSVGVSGDGQDIEDSEDSEDEQINSNENEEGNMESAQVD